MFKFQVVVWQGLINSAMLHISVSNHRKFEIACDVATVEKHFSDFERMVEDLPDLKIVRAWGPKQYRIRYKSNTNKVYTVNLISDVQARFDPVSHALLVSPLRGHPSVSAKATLRSLTGQGDYTSRLVFHSKKGGTVVDYDLSIDASIPKPVRLSLVPDSVARILIQAVVKYRVQEIADLFVNRTVSRLAR